MAQGGTPQASGRIGAAQDKISIDVLGMSSVGFQISGTWTGTLVFEGLIDGAAVALSVTPPAGGSAVSSTTSNGIWVGSVAGLRLAWVRCSAYTDGTAIISLQAEESTAATAAGSGSAPSGVIGEAVPATASPLAVEDASGDLAYPKLDALGQLMVVLPAGGSGLTDAELRATPVPMSLAGSATSAKQDTGNTSLASIDGKITAVNTGAVVVSSSALPSGAATEATVSSVDGKLPALVGGRVPVVLPAGGSGLTDAELRATPVPMSATNLDIRDLSFAADTVDVSGSTLGANSGVDIGDVTINNASIAVTNGGTFATQVDGSALTALQLIDDPVSTLGTTTYTETTSKGMLIGVVRRDADTTLVDTTNEIAPLQVDANGRLKVEAFSGETLPVSLATLPALVAGTANIGDVDVLSLPASTNTIEVVGDVAQDVAVAGNPVLIGYRASTAIPSAMSADGRSVHPWANRNGAQMVAQAPHVGLNGDPWSLVHEAATYTSAQTSTVLVAGGASEKLVVTQVQIQAYATTAGTLQLYFGTGAFSRGTSRAVFDGEFAPSATLKPGVVMNGPFIAGANGDDLMVTTVGAMSVTINVWYYVVT